MTKITGKINLPKELSDLAITTTHMRNPSSTEKPIMAKVILIPYQEPAKDNVLLTLEGMFNKEFLKLFLQKNPESLLTKFMCKFLGEAYDKGTSIMLSYAQTDQTDVCMFIAINEHFKVNWFSTLSENDFKTYLRELKKFSEITQEAETICLN